MKKILVMSLLLVSSDVFAALALKCNFNKDNLMLGGHALVVGAMGGGCKDFKGNSYNLVLAGIGPGLEVSLDSKVFVYCPTASKKRLERKKAVGFVAGHGSASFLIGIQGGAALNFRGGSCFLFGLNRLAIGASAKVGGMWIFKKEKDEEKKTDTKPTEEVKTEACETEGSSESNAEYELGPEYSTEPSIERR